MSKPRGNSSGPFFTDDATDPNDPLHHPRDQGPGTDSFVPSTNVPSGPDGPDGHADTFEAIQPGVPDSQPDHGGAKDVLDDLQTSNKTNLADDSTTDHVPSHQDQVLLDGFDLGDSHPAPAGIQPVIDLPPTTQTGSTGGSHTTSAAAGSGFYATYTSNPSGPFHLVINFDASVSKAPADFIPDVEKVADFFTSHFNNATTVTIDVGFGEVDGYKIGGSALGESISSYSAASYGALAGAFNATSLKDDPSAPAAALPANDPVTSAKHAYWVTTAEAKAIGLPAQNASVDGYIGLSSAANTFDYHTSDGVTGYDFVGTAAHEISEVMGRQVLVGEKSQGIPGYMPLDLFHYSSPGVRDFVGTTPGYFSIDGGQTDQPTKAFNTQPNGDFADWAPATQADSFDASGGLNQVAPVTHVDYLTMEGVGWTGTGWTGDWT